MSEPVTINLRIIESLYCEALMLTGEVRNAFNLPDRIGDALGEEDIEQKGDMACVTLSCEALRTTTRMMQAMAWLLNHQAYFKGELSKFQLHRRGRLPLDTPGTDEGLEPLIDPHTRALIDKTKRFYARLIRLDRNWRLRDPAMPSAIDRLRQRLERRVGS